MSGETSPRPQVGGTDVSQRSELDLRLAHKLEAVGQLAAGIAHEINTPMQFVGDSVQFIFDSFQELLSAVESYRHAASGAAGATSLEEIERKHDLGYLQERVPHAFARTFEGIDRVRTIVQAMRDFAHSDRSECAPADLNAALRTTLIVAKNEYKYVADVRTELGDLPPVPCNIGEINQVLLNLLVNAAHAIVDVVPRLRERGLIRIATRVEAGHAVITIADDGCGIPAAIRDRVFDPFFTTKAVGKGTGQGLAISRSIIARHGGVLAFTSEPGQGTQFVIRLPLEDRADPPRPPGSAV